MSDNEKTTPAGVNRADLVRVLGSLSPAELAAIGLQPMATAVRGPTTPKLGPVLEAIAVDAVDAVIEACRQGIEIAIAQVRDKREIDETEQLEPLRAVNGAVAAACARNSQYRGKPLVHSLQVAITRLMHIHG